MEDLHMQKTISHKILFTGLDGAGKTSIIKTLQRELANVIGIEPTRGAERTSFSLMNHQISEWDLGGQEIYRIAYLKNPNKYFDGTEIAIYVIDILNIDRIEESLSYLKDVLEKFEELNLNPTINVFFHKLDPKLIKSEYLSKTENFIDNMKYKINKINNRFDIRFFETSIFNFHSIVNAVSKVLLQLYPKSQLIHKTVEDFAERIQCEGLLISGTNSLTIGVYYENDFAREIISNTTRVLLGLNDLFKELGIDKENDHILINKANKHFLLKELNLGGSTERYYVILLKEKNPFNIPFVEKEFEIFVELISDIIKSKQ